MNKKLVALGLASLMTLSSGTTAVLADSAVEGSDLTAAITLWTYPVGDWGNAETVDGLLADFNAKYPNISVTVEYLDYTNGDDQVNTAIEGGQAPDMVLEGPERLVANWGAKGYMVDLSDILEKGGADIYDTIKTSCTSPEGAVYEYPLCMIAHSMAINRDIFEAADALQYLNEETNTWNSTEDFLKAVQAVYDSGHADVGAVYCGGQGGDQGTRALINNMYGGEFTAADHSAYTAASEANNKAIQALVDQDGINFDASLQGGDEINLFRQGVLAMAFCWNAQQQNNTDNNDAGLTNDGATILPMNFPTEDGSAPKLCGGIWGFGVFDNGDADRIEASKLFIDFMANDAEEAPKAVLASKFFPVHSEMGNIYEGTDIADTMAMFTANFMPNMGDYYQVTSGWAEARTAWWNMLQAIGTGSDVAEQTAAFDETANAALAAAQK